MTWTKRLEYGFKASVPRTVPTKEWYESHTPTVIKAPDEPLVPIVERVVVPCRHEKCTIAILHEDHPEDFVRRKRRRKRRESTVEVIGDPPEKATPAEGRRKRYKQGFQTPYTIKRMQPGPRGPIAIVGCTWCLGKGCDMCYGEGEMPLMLWHQRQR